MRTLAKLCCVLFAAAALVLVFPAPRASMQTPSDSSEAGASSMPAAILQARLLPQDPTDSDSFGKAVALSADGNTALVGNDTDNKTGVFVAGAAYVYTRSAAGVWTQQARLQASDIANNAFFGNAVALSADGNTALVSISPDGNGPIKVGAAYVFTRSGNVWTQQQRLQADDTGVGDGFGGTLALSADGNIAFVSAGGDDHAAGVDAGSLYVFTRSGGVWTQQQRLQADDAGPGDVFGTVAITPDAGTVLVGAAGDNNSGGSDAGSAYVFIRNGATWTQQARIQAADGGAGDNFGFSVALGAGGNTALVGAHRDDHAAGVDAGSAYVFTRSGTTWTQQQRLQAGDARPDDFFGGRVALSVDGNVALVTAHRADDGERSLAGAAYVFTRSGAAWAQQHKLQIHDPTSHDEFGTSAALSADGNTALVGAAFHRVNGLFSGAAYVFVDTSQPVPSRIDDTAFFVRQHYLDFFSREPDAEGFAHWTGVIDSCGADAQCREVRRINVSAAFFLSIEFQETGYLVYRIYKAAYGDATGVSTLGGTHQLLVPIVRFEEFLPDTQRVGNRVIVNQGDWQGQLEANKTAFTQEFVQRQRFLNDYPLSLTPTQFVDRLNGRAGGPLDAAERQALINELTANNTTAGRASVLRKVAEDPTLDARELNRAFVLMQYFGYLRRDPNEGPDTDHTGYDFWLGNLNRFNGNFEQAEMVKAFISSFEYRQRFVQ